MPQIAQIGDTYLSQLFWLLLTFGFIYFVIGRGMLTKVVNTVDLRDRKIAEDLAAAQAAQDRVQALHADVDARAAAMRADAHSILAKAKAKAAEQTAADLAKADSAISARLDAAEARIAEAGVKAQGDIETIAGDIAHELVMSLSGATVTRADAAKLAKELANG